MEDLLKYGLNNDIFEPKRVISLFYGNLRYFHKETVASQKTQHFYEWDAYPLSIKDWHDIPHAQRLEIVALTIKKASSTTCNDLSYFHDRMLCLMHELLDDAENKIECYERYDGSIDTRTYPKYSAFIDPKICQALITEMFLWWYMGVRKTDEERRLLKQCWIKFLGFERKNSLKNTLFWVTQKIKELDLELSKANRIRRANDALIKKRYIRERKEIKKRHLSRQKKEFLLTQIEQKDDVAHHRFWQAQSNQNRCNTALCFLRGFLDYVSITAELKQNKIS